MGAVVCPVFKLKTRPGWEVLVVSPEVNDVTSKPVPKRSVASVPAELCFKCSTPPRTLTVAEGELKTIGLFFEILPPISRKTPLLMLTTMSPVPVVGS